MEENTLFQGQQPGVQPPAPQTPVAQPDVPPSDIPQQPPVPPAAEEPPVSHESGKPAQSHNLFGGFPPPTHDEEEEHSGFPFGMILKIVLGLVLLLAIGFGIFRFVIPLFSPKNEQVTLTYWGLWESEGIMQQAINGFEREHPNIKVKYVRQDIKEYRERLTTRIPNGNGPDIFRYHNTWFPMLGRLLSPLPESVITKPELQKAYYPVVQKDIVYNGALYGIPLQIDTLALFVNKDIFSAGGINVPKTWDEFNAATRTLTVKDETGKIKTAGAAIGTFDNIDHAPDILSLLFLQNGANVENLAETPENASDALTFYTSFAQGEGNIWDETLANSLVMFAQGNVGMYFGYSWDVFAITAANPSLSFAVYPVPSIPGRDVTLASYWVEGVSRKSTHQKEAMEFMHYLAKQETQQKLFSEAAKTRPFGELYSRVSMAETLKSNTLAYPFVQQAKTATSSFFVSSTYDNGLNADMNTYLGNAVRSILSNTSPQTAVDTLAKGVTQILGQYGQ